MTTTTVTSQIHPLAYAKAIVALIGSIASGLLGVYATDTTVGQVLTVLVVIATAVGTWTLPNAPVVSSGNAGLVNEVGEGEEGSVLYVGADGGPDPYDPGAPLHGVGQDPAPADGDPHRPH